MAQLGLDYFQGAISPEAEKSGVDQEKTQMVVDNASAKVGVYLRNAGEGLKKVAWLTLQQYIKNAHTREVQMLIEEITPGVPFLAAQDALQDSMKKDDLICKVGLGNLDNPEKFKRISALFQLTGMAAQFGVTPPPQKIINMLHEAASVSGFDNYQDFVTTPQEHQQSQQGKQMLEQLAMQKAQAETQKAQAEAGKAQAEAENTQADTSKKLADADATTRKISLEEWQAQIDATLTAETLSSSNPNPNFKIGG